MINLVWDDGFIRKLRKIIKRHPELSHIIKSKLKLLSEDPYNITLRTHKLTGNLRNIYSCSVDYDIRLIFEKIDKENFQLIDIGTHDEVY